MKDKEIICGSLLDLLEDENRINIRARLRSEMCIETILLSHYKYARVKEISSCSRIKI